MCRPNYMNRQIIQTEDGSPSIYLPDMNEHYHSIHGALQESLHVFIQEGLLRQAALRKRLHILEVGLGTGLNCLLSYRFAVEEDVQISYYALEPYPLKEEEYNRLIYGPPLDDPLYKNAFQALHRLSFKKEMCLSPSFHFIKKEESIQAAVLSENVFNLVYFDAFGPDVQAEMWTEEVFAKVFSSMAVGGMLLTYSAKGSVKRALRSCGFQLEHPRGAAGKREMTRAIKPDGRIIS
jgi:tRNA U34 5-methylaminomethyl-2-thiouridine-forming methyltransferase MnmC